MMYLHKEYSKAVIRQIRSLVETALKERKISAREASMDVVGHDGLIRDIRAGRIPRVDRLQALFQYLGLGFYLGPPRDEAAPIPPGEIYAGEKSSWAVTMRDELMAHLTAATQAALDETISRLLQGKNNFSDDKAFADPALSAEGREQPAAGHIEVRELAVAAGGGTEVLDETVTGYVVFRRDWLTQKGVDPAQCCVIGVKGVSMEPTLPEGCSILVNRAQRRRWAKRIYVVRNEEGLVVKRAGKDKRGKWQLLSDHPSWEPVPWSKGTEVIGEVRWMGRTFR